MTIVDRSRLAWAKLSDVDPALWAAMEGERDRQHWKIELIASENYTFAAVMEAQGSWLTNKYAEGLPGRRYYGGCEFVDVVERLAQDRALALFPGSEHVNVQPHAGAQANFAAYFAVLDPGDSVMGLNLSHGGHLTHGMGLNFSGRLYEIHAYGVDRETERFDYDEIERMAQEVRPKMIVAGATAYSRIIDFERLGRIAHAVDALLFVDMAHIAGLVAAGLHPSPFGHADIVTTTTHKTLRGPRGGLILCHEEHAKAIDKSVFPGGQGGPLEHVIAGKAVAFGEALTPDFVRYVQQVVTNAQVLAEALMACGFAIVSGGTDTHLMLVDLRSKELTGKEAEKILGAAGITVNKNTIPDDPASPFVTSGIRIGTSALTTRGMGTGEMARIAGMIDTALTARDEATLARVKGEAEELGRRFPLYGIA